jgi:hypothetical protein
VSDVKRTAAVDYENVADYFTWMMIAADLYRREHDQSDYARSEQVIMSICGVHAMSRCIISLAVCAMLTLAVAVTFRMSVSICRPSTLRMKQSNALVTFVIPTSGRGSLVATMQSVVNQTSNDWKAIVIFDKVQINGTDLWDHRVFEDIRIKKLALSARTGRPHMSGHVRNIGLSLVDTPWAAFVDDDDELSQHYVTLMHREQHGFDVLIFRMWNPPILPPLEARDIQRNRVGISFALRSNFSDRDRQFVPSATEDFDLLDRLCHYRLKCIILPYLAYYVKGRGKDAPLIQGTRQEVPHIKR